MCERSHKLMPRFWFEQLARIELVSHMMVNIRSGTNLKETLNLQVLAGCINTELIAETEI